jgi:hypothetical protein
LIELKIVDIGLLLLLLYKKIKCFGMTHKVGWNKKGGERETGRQGDRETERQRDRETERQREKRKKQTKTPVQYYWKDIVMTLVHGS